MTVSTSIRIATVNDADRMAHLCTQLGYPTDAEDMRKRIAETQQQHHIVFVADSADQPVVGWIHAHVCHLIISSPLVVIFGLVVDDPFRRDGIGKLLMQSVENWGQEQGCHKILVRSNILRSESHLFYEKIGYENIKQSIVYQKTLTQ
jgi:GNAT superfamily N-acetyltransferase